MKRFVEGEDRYQSTLFPETLDDLLMGDALNITVEATVDDAVL